MAAVSEGLPAAAPNPSSSLGFASVASLKWANQTLFGAPKCNPTPDPKSFTHVSLHFHSPKRGKTSFTSGGRSPPSSTTRHASDALTALRDRAKSTGNDAAGEEEEEEESDAGEGGESGEELGVTGSPLSVPETRPRSLRLRGLAPPLGGEEKKKLEIPRLSISLSREEIEEDVWAFTGSRPSRRPKKRPRNIQKKLDQTFPGLWLPTVSVDRYRIADQSESRKEVDIVRRFLKSC